MSFLVLFCSLFNLYMYFYKKLLALLMLELSFLSLISLFFSHGPSGISGGGFSIMMIFLGFMVLDSVFGICLLILSSRNSTPFVDPFFGH